MPVQADRLILFGLTAAQSKTSQIIHVSGLNRQYIMSV